jgi:hypothetical protein
VAARGRGWHADSVDTPICGDISSKIKQTV